MSGGRIHWSFWGHCLPENREPGAESEGLDARLASALYAPLGCVMQGLKNKTLSSKISSHDWLCGEVRFICRLQRLPDNSMKNVLFPTLGPSPPPHPISSPSKQLCWSFVQNQTAVWSWFQVHHADLLCTLFPRQRWRRCPLLPQPGSAHPGLQAGKSLSSPTQTAAPWGEDPLEASC